MTVATPALHALAQQPEGPLIIAIMDGVGWGPGDGGDAVASARTPHLDALWRDHPTRTLRAHGLAVGLPSDGDMGNSEVGHNALGAGRVLRQGAALVNDAFVTGSLLASECWRWLVGPLVTGRPTGATLHLCGLLSDGNVHAHMDHVLGLVAGAHASGVQRLRVHALADGRDVADPSYERYLSQLDVALTAHRAAGRDYQIASGGGRMRVTMDRYDSDWRIVERGWQAHVRGAADGFSDWSSAVAALRTLPGGHSDQLLGPWCIVDGDGQPIGPVIDGDAFILWNFRGDRALQLTRAFEQGSKFSGFERGLRPKIRFAGMMQYDGDLHLPARYLVAPPVIDQTLGEFIAACGLRTLATSETQKYGHVTYFWNGNRSGCLDDQLERYVEVPSDRMEFDQRPIMRAAEITDVVAAALAESSPPDVIRLNYANGDMVGHTGNLAATIAAVEAVDTQVGRLVELVRRHRGVLVLTADHGNADDMWMRDKEGQPKSGPDGYLARTSHTLSPVPLTVFDVRDEPRWRLRDDLPQAGLANVAATVLELLGRQAPPHMAPSLLRWQSEASS